MQRKRATLERILLESMPANRVGLKAYERRLNQAWANASTPMNFANRYRAKKESYEQALQKST
jgi:hypothetical protein